MKKRTHKFYFAYILSVVSFVATLAVTFTPSANALDVNRWIFCDVLPEPSKDVYQVATTDDIPFYLRSRSAQVSGLDDVSGNISNSILTLTGMDFASVNASITGRTVGDGKLVNGDTEVKVNEGPKVTPFDRFGVAGLNFTGYMGEWKYYYVDACASTEAQDPKAGVFYSGRLEPRSTWEDVGNSIDPRTVQFNKGVGAHIDMAAFNLVANGIFSLTKFIVATTIAFINLSFSDVPKMIGLTDLIGGENGLFTVLTEGIYFPFLVLGFLSIAVYLVVSHLKKRTREGFIALGRGLALLVLGSAMTIMPTQIMSLPSNIAIAGQTFVIASMNHTISSSTGMCATDSGSVKKLVEHDGKVSFEESSLGKIEQIGKTASSSVACQLWEALLFKPWSEAQFGKPYTKLWANGSTAPDWVEAPAFLTNSNTDMVGDADVPLGGGTSWKNWALYHVSTQTNVHVSTEKPEEPAHIVSGVNADWWRIVDALSNYEEQPRTEKPADGMEYTYPEPKQNPVSDSWDTWVGNSAYSRVGYAFTSLFYAIMTLIAPLVLAGSSIVMKLTLPIIMLFLPVFTILAIFPWGWDSFKKWWGHLLNTVILIVVTTLLFMVSLIFLLSILAQSASTSWVQTIITLVLVSVIIVKSRHQIMNAISFVQLSSGSIGGIAEKIKSNTVGRASKGVKMGTQVLAGGLMSGVASQTSGGSFSGGALAGAKRQFVNMSYSSGSRLAKNVREQYETQDFYDSDADFTQLQCSNCFRPLVDSDDSMGESVFNGVRDSEGNYYCYNCFTANLTPDDVVSVSQDYTRKDEDSKSDRLSRSALRVRKRQEKKEEKIHQAMQLSSFSSHVPGSYSKRQAKGRMREAFEGVNDKGYSVSRERRENALMSLAQQVDVDIAIHKEEVANTGDVYKVDTLQVPELIKGYVDEDIIQQAWLNCDYDYVRIIFAAAFVAAFNDSLQENDGEMLNPDDFYERLENDRRKSQ